MSLRKRLLNLWAWLRWRVTRMRPVRIFPVRVPRDGLPLVLVDEEHWAFAVVARAWHDKVGTRAVKAAERRAERAAKQATAGDAR